MGPAPGGPELSSIYHLLKSPLAAGPDASIGCSSGLVIVQKPPHAQQSVRLRARARARCHHCASVVTQLRQLLSINLGYQFVTVFLVENALEDPPIPLLPNHPSQQSQQLTGDFTRLLQSV